MASGMVTIPFRRMASVVRCGRRRCPISAMPPWYHLGVLSSWPTFVPAGVSLSFARRLLVAVGHATTAGERAGAPGQGGEDVADRGEEEDLVVHGQPERDGEHDCYGARGIEPS